MVESDASGKYRSTTFDNISPKNHFNDIRDLDGETGAALMLTLSKITKAVSECFPNDGLSIWHSIGPAAFQEVPHLHIHVHPRQFDDDFLRVYPSKPNEPGMDVLKQYADQVKMKLKSIG